MCVCVCDPLSWSGLILTKKAFPCRVDYGQVVAGTSTDNQVKWPPLFNLQRTKNIRTRSRYE